MNIDVISVGQEATHKNRVLSEGNMVKHSFICNACIYFNAKIDEELNIKKCNKCNGAGYEWQPINKELYKKDPCKFMEHLILAAQ